MKKVFLVIGIILGILIIGIGGVAAYDYTLLRDSLGLGLPRDPQAAIKKVWENTINSNSLQLNSEISLNLNIPTSKLEVKKINLPIKHEIIYLKPNKLKTDFNVETKSLVDNFWSYLKDNNLVPKKYLTDNLKKELVKIQIEGIVLENKAFIRIPLLLNEWVSFESSGLSKNLELKDIIGSGDEIIKLGKDYKKLKDENIDGVRCYHFQAKVNLDELEKNNKIANLLDGLERYSISEKIDVEKEIQELIRKTDNSVDIYIDKRKLIPKKLQFYFKLSTPFVFEFNYNSTFSKINQIAEIKAPTQPKKIESLQPADLNSTALGKVIYELYFSNQMLQTGDAKRKSDLKMIQTALKSYAADHKGKYPLLTDTSRDGKFLEILVPKYLNESLVDPINNDKYFYQYISKDGIHYTLSCQLENKKDPESKNGLYKISK